METDLVNERTAGAVSLEHSWYGGSYGDGNYEWGSRLDRVGPFRA
jgi:hypothetical protein